MRIQADKSISEFLNSLISISEPASKIQHSHSLLLQKMRTATINRLIDKVSATTLITNYFGHWSRLWFLLIVNTFWFLSSSLTANWMFYGCGQNKTFEDVILGLWETTEPPKDHGEIFISEVLLPLPPNTSETRFYGSDIPTSSAPTLGILLLLSGSLILRSSSSLSPSGILKV